VLKECILHEIESMGCNNYYSNNDSCCNNDNNCQSLKNNDENIVDIISFPNMYHIQFDEGSIWSSIELLKISLLKNSPFKSRDKFDAIINILFDHEAIRIYNYQLKQFISIVVNKMISNKAAYKLFRLPSTKPNIISSTLSKTSVSKIKTTIILSLEKKKRKNDFIDTVINTNNMNDNYCMSSMDNIDDNNLLETSILSDTTNATTTTIGSSTLIMNNDNNNNNIIMYQKSIGLTYKKRNINKNNFKNKNHKKYEKFSYMFDNDYYLNNDNNDNNSITTATSDSYIFDASSIFDDMNDIINMSSSSSSSSSCNMAYDDNMQQPWDYLNDISYIEIASPLIYNNYYNNKQIFSLINHSSISLNNNTFNNNNMMMMKYNDYFQPFPLEYQPKRHRYCKTCCADDHQFVAF